MAQEHVTVLERENGYYGGYRKKRDGEYEQIFNTGREDLFFSLKQHADGAIVTFLDKSEEKDFMAGRKTLLEML